MTVRVTYLPWNHLVSQQPYNEPWAGPQKKVSVMRGQRKTVEAEDTGQVAPTLFLILLRDKAVARATRPLPSCGSRVSVSRSSRLWTRTPRKRRSHGPLIGSAGFRPDMPNDVIKDSTSGIALNRDGVGQEPPEATWYDVEASWLMMLYHAAWLSDTQGGACYLWQRCTGHNT